MEKFKAIAMIAGCVSFASAATANSCVSIPGTQTTYQHTYDKYEIKISGMNGSTEKIKVHIRPRNGNCTVMPTYTIFRGGDNLLQEFIGSSDYTSAKIYSDPMCDSKDDGYFYIDTSLGYNPLNEYDDNGSVSMKVRGTEKTYEISFNVLRKDGKNFVNKVCDYLMRGY